MYYKEQAEKIITALTPSCMSPDSSQSILQKATVFFRANEKILKRDDLNGDIFGSKPF